MGDTNAYPVAESTASLSGRKRRRRITQAMLRQTRNRGRGGALMAIAAIAPVADRLMGAVEWRVAVEQIVDTESWWVGEFQSHKLRAVSEEDQ